MFFLFFSLAATEDPERASAQRLLSRTQQLPEGPARGRQSGERFRCQSQSQFQGVGGFLFIFSIKKNSYDISLEFSKA